MRFLIYGIFLAGWLTMWIWIYTCHIKKACCPGRFAQEMPAQMQEPEMNLPIAFVQMRTEPVTGAGFAFFRDSLIARLDSGKVLEITGLFTESEDQSIGADRAVAVLDILASQLDDHRYTLRSREVRQSTILEGDGNYLAAYEVKILSQKRRMDSIVADESH
jgi:hypothetical protein